MRAMSSGISLLELVNEGDDSVSEVQHVLRRDTESRALRRRDSHAISGLEIVIDFALLRERGRGNLASHHQIEVSLFGIVDGGSDRGKRCVRDGLLAGRAAGG